MLKMVKMLRRLLRKAFLLTKRVRVMIELPEENLVYYEGPRIPKHSRWVQTRTTSRLPSHSIADHETRYQWRSSPGFNDKCHPGPSEQNGSS